MSYSLQREIVPGQTQIGCEKLGAVIYLRTAKPLPLAEFVSTFHERWPDTPLTEEGHSGNLAGFGSGDCHFGIEICHSTVPQAVIDSALPCRHWPNAEKEIAPHSAYLKITATVTPDRAVTVASDLTRVIVALISIADPIAVCWLNASVLNGSVMHPARDFVAIASELLEANTLPLMLWIAAHWKPEEHVIHTTGMIQLGAPEIFLAQQPGPSVGVVEYLFDLAQYVLTSEKNVSDGDTVDGPKGLLRIETMRGRDPGRKALFLVPVHPS